MTQILQIEDIGDPQDAVHQAVQRLVEGGVIGIRTETTYVLAALAAQEASGDRFSEALRNLSSNGTGVNKPGASILVSEPDAAIDFVPQANSDVRRMLARCWPSPLAIRFSSQITGGLGETLPESVRHLLLDRGYLSIQCSAARLVRSVMRLCSGPLMITDVSVSQREYPSAGELQAEFDESVTLILDSGAPEYPGQPTVVAFDDAGKWDVVQTGMLDPVRIRRLMSEVYLFVCTGNTCRSPMAEAMFRRMLAERLECADDELPDHGYVVISAGIAAAPGMPASQNSIEALRPFGIDLSAHESQMASPDLLELADHIYTMTAGHREAILRHFPHLSDRVELLSPTGESVPDPIGGPQSEYNACRDAIGDYLENRLP